MSTAILLAILEIFGFFLIGVIAKSIGYIKDSDIDQWSKFAIDFLYPFFIFNSITNDLQKDRLFELWPLPVIGFGLVIIGYFSGVLLQYGLFSKDNDIKKTFVHFCTVNNSAYLPIIIVQQLWGASALANLFLLNLGSTVGFWTIGVGVLKNGKIFKNFSNLISINLIAVILSVVVSISGLNKFIPFVFKEVFQGVGVIAVPLILILIGASLANFNGIRINWHVVYVSFVRLTIIPAISIIILKLLPLSNDVYSVSVIVALMPIAVASVLMTRRFGGSLEYAMSTALISTLSAAVTVPLALLILF